MDKLMQVKKVKMFINKSILVLIFFVLIMLETVFAQTQYKVSGKVTRNGKNIAGTRINVSTALDFNELGKYFSKNQTDQNNFKASQQINKQINKNAITDQNGFFSFYLANGTYEINCLPDVEFNDGDEYISVGPDKIKVANKNLVLELRLFTKTEIIEGNKTFLNELPLPAKSVLYTWGKLPLFSENDCKKKIQEKINSLESLFGISGIVAGSPLVFYDLNGNPIFYKYSCYYKQVEIASYGVFAIGYKPEFAAYNHEMFKIDEDSLNKKKGKESLKDYYMVKALNTISEQLKCDKNDIKIDSYICLAYSAPCALKGTIISKSKVFVITLDDDFVIVKDNDANWLETLGKYIEREFTFEYIRQIKNSLKKSLL